MTSAVVVGSTGLVGSNILQTLLSLPLVNSVTTLSRRPPRASSDKLNAITSEDNSTWCGHLAKLTPTPNIFFSGLATTKAAAGSFAAQYKIDHELNVELATAAKKAGIKVYVLISAGGANPHSYVPYGRMKGETEEAVKALGFEKTIILRPGLLVGDRVEYDKRGAPEHIVLGAARFLRRFVGYGATDFWAQDADVVAKAAVSAALKAANGEGPAVWTMGQGEIVRLGKTEWKEEK